MDTIFWKWQMRTCTFVKFAVLLLAIQQSLLLHSTALKVLNYYSSSYHINITYEYL